MAATTRTTTMRANIYRTPFIGGCDSAAKMPKVQRTVNVGIRKSGGSARPTTGQIYPRGE